MLVGADRERFEKVRKEHTEAGVPPELSARIASLEANNAALDIVELATQHKTRVAEMARIYFEVGARIGLDWLREQVERLPSMALGRPWRAAGCATTRCASIVAWPSGTGTSERGSARCARREPGSAPRRRIWRSGSARSATCAPPVPPTSRRYVGVEAVRKVAE